MAEKETSAAGGVVANRPTGPEVTIQDSVEKLIEQAPAPSDKASKSYQVLYPNDRFVMEGMPVVTGAGTPLTDAQAKELLPVAEASGVRIVEVSS